MSKDHEMPDDPSPHPEQALDAMEENVFGSTMDQERDDDSADPDQEDAQDATTAPPTTTESPA